MTHTFTCAMCRQTFESDRTEEEADAECLAVFGCTKETEPCNEVCDDCWGRIDPHQFEVA